MKKLLLKLIPVAVLILIGIFLLAPARRWARGHVDYLTATNDHPLNCLSCHMHNNKDGLVAKLVNADYYSPFNLAVSKDGKKLFVVAEEGNALLIVNTEKQKVTYKIKVGERPHSV